MSLSRFSHQAKITKCAERGDLIDLLNEYRLARAPRPQEASGAPAPPPASPSPAPSISRTEVSVEKSVTSHVKMEPAPPHYTKLDVTLGPPPPYESLEAGDSLDEEAVKTKVQKYSAILMHVACTSATQGQVVLGGDGGIGRQPTKEITQTVNKWERAGKSSHRKTIATALKRILEGASDVERLRPHHPPWTKLEEACVKKVFEYKCMPYTDLLLKAKGLESDDFASSGDERSPGDGDDNPEPRALLAVGEEAPLPSLLAARCREVGDDGSEVETKQPLAASYFRMWSPEKKATPQAGGDEARMCSGLKEPIACGDSGACAGAGDGGPGNADNDPHGWMHLCLARLLPESVQSNEKLWNGTISALKVCVCVCDTPTPAAPAQACFLRADGSVNLLGFLYPHSLFGLVARLDACIVKVSIDSVSHT